MFIRLSFLYIEMKELCEPSVKRNQFKIFRQCSLRWTPQSVSGVDILADTCWTPTVSVCRWYLGWPMLDCPPTQKIISVMRWYLCWLMLDSTPNTHTHTHTHTHKERQHNKCYCTCSYDVSRIATMYMLEITYTDMFFFLLLVLYSWWIFLYI